jgi:hypothetical protein
MTLLRGWIGTYSEDEVFLDARVVACAVRRCGFTAVQERYLTPTLSPSFLTPRNRILARLLYTAAAMGRGSFTQSFFLMQATRE